MYNHAFELAEEKYTGKVWNVVCEIEDESGEVWFPFDDINPFFKDENEAVEYAKETFDRQTLADVVGACAPEDALGAFVHVISFDCEDGEMTFIGEEPYYAAYERDELVEDE